VIAVKKNDTAIGLEKVRRVGCVYRLVNDSAVRRVIKLENGGENSEKPITKSFG